MTAAAWSEHYVVRAVPRSGKNSQRRLRLGNGRTISARSKAAEAWIGEAFAQLLAQRPPRVPLDAELHLDLAIHHRLGLEGWDSDNVVSLVFDALKGALIVRDDCAAIIRSHHVETFVDVERPRVEVIISLKHTRSR